MNRPFSYRGRWIVTADFRLLENAYLVISDEEIREVTLNRPDGKVIEHDGIILPGLVNAHTHLEFSDLKQPLGTPGMGFVEWIGQVMRYRRQRDPSDLSRIVQSGLDESRAAGTCALGEISTFEWGELLADDGTDDLDIVDFRELIGFRPDQHPDIVEKADQFLVTAEVDDSTPLLKFPGLSPHAPYSINRRSLEYAVELSRHNDLPLAMHLAETREELELLRDHRGPFRDLLDKLDLWTEANFPLGTTPLAFLHLLSRADRALVIHGNYLNTSELEFLAAHQEVLSLVYCPRTHAYFQHEPYPLEDIFRLGIRLALGTDSRASNPDLSIWNEMKFLLQRGNVPTAEIIRMGTINGAMALGLDKSIGTLQVGKQASPFLAPSPDHCELSRAIVRDLPSA